MVVLPINHTKSTKHEKLRYTQTSDSKSFTTQLLVLQNVYTCTSFKEQILKTIHRKLLRNKYSTCCWWVDSAEKVALLKCMLTNGLCECCMCREMAYKWYI